MKSNIVIPHGHICNFHSLPGSVLPNPMNGMTRENEMAATTMKPNHQAPTHVGSAGVMSRLVKEDEIMKKTKEGNISIQIMSNWKLRTNQQKCPSNLIRRGFLY